MQASNSGGAKVITIGGRMVEERERLIGMTPEEREWRSRFLKSQELAPNEPIDSKEYYKACYNPIRRFYRFPLNCLENSLIPVVGKTSATIIRYTIAKSVMSLIGMYVVWYHFKYNHYNWESRSGWKFAPTREMTLPGTLNYKGLVKPEAWVTYGFENSPI